MPEPPPVWRIHGQAESLFVVDERPGNMRYIKESRIAAPPEAVFAFHESPGALQQLIPPWEKVRVVHSDGSLQPGSRVVLEWGRVSPLRFGR